MVSERELVRPEPVPPCRGACRGDRPAWESPAKFGRQNGRQVVFCPCCMKVLMPSSKKDMTKDIAAGRFDPSITFAGARLFRDNDCGYDVIVAKEVKAT